MDIRERLSLSKAIQTGRLKEFVAQEEKRGVGPVEIETLENTIARLLKVRQAKDQTSRSPKRGDSRGK